MGSDYLEITFYMDGTGIIMNPLFPIHFDSLLNWAICPETIFNKGLEKNEIPKSFNLPLEKWRINNMWGWQASALFPNIKKETVQYWRKKTRLNRLHITNKSVNLRSGKYKEYNQPMSLILTNKIKTYAFGNYKEISSLLKHIKYIGKKGASGKGLIVKTDTKKIKNNYSLEKNKKMMRFLPTEKGNRYGRIRPPYWNATEKEKTCYVNDPTTILK